MLVGRRRQEIGGARTDGENKNASEACGLRRHVKEAAMFSAAFPAMLRSCRVSRSVCLRIGKTGPLMSFSYYSRAAGMKMETGHKARNRKIVGSGCQMEKRFRLQWIVKKAVDLVIEKMQRRYGRDTNQREWFILETIRMY